MAKAIYLEDLSVGTRFESAEYEMTAEAIIAFAREFGYDQPAEPHR